jgi:predicted esterase
MLVRQSEIKLIRRPHPILREKCKTNNPFEILEGKEDRLIDLDELTNYAAKQINNGKRVNDISADMVHEVSNETSVFMAMGVNNKGASTPSRDGFNG